MTLPSDLTTITVTGTYKSIDGTPLTGQVSFSIPVPQQDATGQVILGIQAQSVTLNSSGYFAIILACTDNAGLNPGNFTYLVTEQIPGLGRAYTVALPHSLGSTVDLAQLAPVVPPPAPNVFQTANTWTATQTFGGSPGIKITQNPVAGEVLVSDASGNATWQPVPPQADYAPTGLTGATAASRYVGATTGGAPASGTFAVGDFVIDQLGKIWVCTTAGTPGTWAQIGSSANAGVVITTTGSTFSPNITLTAGSTATVTWIYNNAVVATGLTPTISFGSAATRTVRMYATDSNGFNALSQIQIFNIGYYNLDTGPWSPSNAYLWPAQAVSGVQNINLMTGLQWFLAQEVTGITGTLDFTGMSNLTVADMHMQDNVTGALTGVNLSGCTSLRRLGVEACNLAAIDLNPVAGSLRDLRGAIQAGGALAIAPLSGTLVGQYHFCVRDQNIGSSMSYVQVQQAPSLYSLMPSQAQMPNIVQMLIWNNQQFGAMNPVSAVLEQVYAYGPASWYSTADFSNCFAFGGGNYVLDMHANQLTSVNLTGCGGLGLIDLHQNPFSQATVDSILATVDSWGTSNKTLNLQNTAAPSGTGTTHVNNLTGRGWTVTVDGSGAPGGGFGSKFTYGESGIQVGFNGYNPLQVSLARAVNSGDLLVAHIQSQGTPSIYDTAGNTWTVLGPYNGNTFLAYCLSSAARSGGITITAWNAAVYGLSASRFVPNGVVSFGGHAASSPNNGGLNAAGNNNLGDLGTVPANALAWGGLWGHETNLDTYAKGFQTGSSGTSDFVGAFVNGAQGTACILYCYCANADAALTWFGNGSSGANAGSMYFTST